MNPMQVLKGSTLFKNWKDTDLLRVADISRQKTLSPGEGLFVEGESSDAFYIVVSGTVAIRKMSDGDEQAVTNVGPNSHIGEMAMLSGVSASSEKRSAGAEAAESSTILEIPFAPFEKILADTPSLGALFYKNMAVTLAARIRRTTEDLASLRALRLRHV